MPTDSVSWVAKVLAVARKDIVSEFRTRYAFNAVVMFALVTLTVISMSLGIMKLTPELAAALFWIILFFAAMSGLAQAFIKEEEGGTAMILKLSADGLVIFFGKFLFNVLLLAMLGVLIVPLFIILLHSPPENWATFMVGVVLGIIGLAGATTIIAAIVAKATVKGALFTVLSFPILMPLLIAVIEISKVSFAGGGFGDISSSLQLLVAYDIVMVTISVMMFDFVWRH